MRTNNRDRANRTKSLRRLLTEALEQRLVLSANFGTSELTPTILTQQGHQPQIVTPDIDVVGDRTTYRGLNVTGYTGDPEAAARSFLFDYADLLGIPQDAEASLSLIDTRYGLASQHVYFQQTYAGALIQDAQINVSMDNSGTIKTVNTSFVNHNGTLASKQVIDVFTAADLAEAEVGVTETWAEGSRELVWTIQDDLTLEPVWRIAIHAAEPVQHDLLAFVNALDGDVAHVEDESHHAVGTGDVFYPNPYQTQGGLGALADNSDATSPELEAQQVAVTLERLNDDTGLLIGDWVDLTLGGGKDVPHADEPSRVYEYTRDDPRFEEVVVYHAIDQVQEYIHSLGYDDDSGPTANGIRDFPTRVNAHWNDSRNAFFSAFDGGIRFGDAGDDVDFAEDADIIVHEYGHALQYSQNPVFRGYEMRAMGEGFSDYLAASFFADVGDPAHQSEHAASVGEWAVRSDLPGLRRVDGDKMYPEDLTGASVHADGEIWSAALWELRSHLGRTLADQVIIESHFELAGDATMVDAAWAVVTADENLTGGANETVIRDTFIARGILEGSDDHGNDARFPTAIQVPSSTAGLIDYEADDDFFEFVAVAGTTYEIQTSVALPGDSAITLYNAADATQVSFNDNGGSDLGSRLVWTAPASGSYQIVVNGPIENTDYVLSIDAIATPVDDFANATDASTQVLNPSVTAGVIEIVGDSDAFSFDVELGSAYSVEVIPGTLEGGHLQLFDAAGVLIGSDTGDGVLHVGVIPAAAATLHVVVSGTAQGTYDFSVEAVAEDHGDSPVDATEISTVPSTTAGEIEFRTDRDAFSFSGIAGVRYVIEAQLDSLRDSVMRLFDEAGTQVAFDDDAGSGLGSQIVFQPSVDGTYFVELMAYGDAYAGTYALSLAADDHRDSAVAATLLPVPGLATAEIEVEGDVDVFAFAAIAGDTIEIVVDVGVDGDSFLTLFDTDGVTSLTTNDDGGTDLGSRILWTIPQDGDYYFEVQGAVARPYAVSVETVATPADDHGDSVETASSIVVPSVTPGFLSVANDTDVFAIDFIEGANYSIELVLGTLDAGEFTIVDAAGNDIASSPDVVTFVPADTGTHYVIVSGQSLGSYDLSAMLLSDDHGNTVFEATTISIPSSTPSVLEYESDRDGFIFGVFEAATYRFEVVLGTLADSVIRLFDSAGNLLVVDHNEGAGLGSLVVQGGLYYLEIGGADDSQLGTYDLVVSFDDHGNTAGNATPVSVPGSANVAFEDPDDVDFFQFTASAGTTLEIVVDARATGDSTLALLGTDGVSVLATNENGGTDLGSRILWTVEEDGDYFVQVAGFPIADPYVLSIGTVAASVDDHGDDEAAATTVAVPSDTPGALEASNDGDVFAFDVLAGASYAVTLTFGATPGSLETGALTIVDSTGTTLGTASSGFAFVAEQAGTYHAFVEGASQGTYEVSVMQAPDDHGDSFVDATELVVPGGMLGELEFPSDQDAFSFFAVAGTYYEIQIVPDVLIESVVRLFDADGTTELAFDSGGVDSVSSLTWQATSDGNRFVVVGGFDDIETGTYELVVAVDDFGNNSSEASLLAVPGSVVGRIEKPGDLDYLEFSAVAGTTLVVDVAVAVDGDSVLTLFDSDGVTQLAVNDNGGVDDGSQLVWAVPADGTYYLEIGGAASLDAYTVSIDTITAPGDDHSDLAATATSVPLLTANPGVIEVIGDVDVFGFDAVAGATYDLALSASNLGAPLEGAGIEIVDSAGVTIVSAGDSAQFVADAAGVYFAFISGDSQGAFELSVEKAVDDHGDSLVDASATLMATAVPGNIDYPSDRDTFVFDALAGERYRFEIVVDTYVNSVLRVLDDSGTELAAAADASTQVSAVGGGAEFGTKIFWEPSIDGTYYLEVSDFNETQAGSYELIAVADDHGDIVQDASSILVGGTVDAQIDHPDDQDVFAFVALAGQTLEVTVDVATGGDSQLLLWENGGATQIAFDDDGGIDAGSMIRWTVPADGNYYLSLQGIEASDPYTLSIATIATPADDIDEETVAIPSVTAGEIEVVNDTDAFTFSATAGTVYRTRLTLDSLGSGEVRIVDPGGNDVYVVPTEDGLAEVTWTALEDGAFLANVSGTSQGTYQFSIEEIIDDHGADVATATLVSPPGITTGWLEVAGDRDTFEFAAVADLRYRFDVQLDSLPDSVLRLFDAAGNLLELDDIGAEGAASRIDWQAPTSGNYYLQVAGVDDLIAGTYELNVATDDHGSLAVDASVITVPGNGLATIEEVDDRDFFVFSGVAGETLNITLDAGVSGDSLLTLYDVDGLTVLAMNDDGGVDNGSQVLWTVPADGDYFIEVAGAAVSDSYVVDIATIPAPLDDHGDLVTTATSVLIPSLSSGDIEVANDTDVFALELLSGASYEIRVIGDTLESSHLVITDLAGEILAMDSEMIVFDSMSTETYFVRVTGDSQGAYELSTEKLPDDYGDVISDATIVATPVQITGVLEYVSDRDAFSFHAIAGVTYQFDLEPTTLDESVLRLFDDAGTELVMESNGGGGLPSQVVWQPSVASLYYLQVGGNNDGFSGAYELSLAIADYGDTSTAASLLLVPGTVQAAIELDDRDFFVFEAVAGATYEIRTTTGLPGDTTLALYDADGATQLAFDDNSGADDGSLILWTATVDQSFFVEVGVPNGSVVPESLYGLTIETVDAPADDFGDSAAEATPLSIPGLASGVIGVANDIDAFSFEGVVGSAYSLELTVGTLETGSLVVADSNGTTVLTATGAEASDIIFVPIADDTYFVLVDGASQGAYDVSLMEIPDDHGELSADATSVVLPGSFTGDLEFASDRDLFSFTAVASTRYRFEILPNTLTDGVLRLLDVDGVTELAVDDTAGDATRILWEPSVDGIYYLEVGSVGDSFVGSYELSGVIDDHGNAAVDATAISIPGTDDALIETATDRDVFSFVAVAGTTLEFTADVGVEGDSRLELFDADGVTPLAFDDNGGAGDGSRILWTVPADGTYYLAVEGAADVNAYVVGVGTVMTPVDDHGNQTTTATSVATPSVTPGIIEVANDADAFAFSVMAGASYAVQLTTSNLASSQLEILDSTGAVVGSGSDQVDFVPLTTGVYYAIVNDGSQGAYELSVARLADDHGDSFVDATPASLASAVAGELDFSGDLDTFVFAANAGGSYRFEVVLGTLPDSVLSLFDSNGNRLAWDDNSGSGLASKITWEAPADGSYYLQIDGSSAGNYEVEFTFPCDYVGNTDGCDIADLDALYLGSSEVPSPLSIDLILKWLNAASATANPLKPQSSAVFTFGDLDLDGKVDSTDLGILLNNFDDQSGLLWGDGNLNSDSTVDSLDLGLLLNSFGHNSVAVAAGFASVSTIGGSSAPAVSGDSITASNTQGIDHFFEAVGGSSEDELDEDQSDALFDFVFAP